MSEPQADLTVVVATRDRPQLLREALAAIAAQDHPGVIETVVVFDQCEPDQAVASCDPRRPVRVLRNARTPGLAGGRNTGILAATAPLVAFCDDDDTWMPTKARRQLAWAAAHPEAELFVTGVVIDDGRAETVRLPATAIRHDDLLASRVAEAHPSSFLVRREALLDGIGLVDEALPASYAEDYDLLLRAARRHPVVGQPEALVRVRWHASSFFSAKWRIIDDALGHLLSVHPEFERCAAGKARIVGQRAFARASSGRRREGVALALDTARLHWREPRAVLALAVAAGVSPNWVLRQLHRRGRGV
jgi:glycosyltransferase involved in cell wall biosynthesis